MEGVAGRRRRGRGGHAGRAVGLEQAPPALSAAAHLTLPEPELQLHQRQPTGGWLCAAPSPHPHPPATPPPPPLWRSPSLPPACAEPPAACSCLWATCLPSGGPQVGGSDGGQGAGAGRFGQVRPPRSVLPAAMQGNTKLQEESLADRAPLLACRSAKAQPSSCDAALCRPASLFQRVWGCGGARHRHPGGQAAGCCWGAADQVNLKGDGHA